MRFISAKVVRDVSSQIPIRVAPWELPVLEVVFGEGNIQLTGDVTHVVKDPDKAYPAPGIEFDRLTKKYGADPETGIPYVVTAYGTARNGISALQRAIEEARKADAVAERKTAPTAAPKSRKRRTAADERDPLTA